MQGIALINAVVLVTEVGDFTQLPEITRQLMAYFGPCPRRKAIEWRGTIRRSGITKTGNSYARRGRWLKARMGLPNEGAHRPS